MSSSEAPQTVSLSICDKLCRKLWQCSRQYMYLLSIISHILINSEKKVSVFHFRLPFWISVRLSISLFRLPFRLSFCLFRLPFRLTVCLFRSPFRVSVCLFQLPFWHSVCVSVLYHIALHSVIIKIGVIVFSYLSENPFRHFNPVFNNYQESLKICHPTLHNIHAFFYLSLRYRRRSTRLVEEYINLRSQSSERVRVGETMSILTHKKVKFHGYQQTIVLCLNF